MTGLVTKSTGSGYRVLLDDGSSVLCRIKGNLRLRGIRTTNPVACGDIVEVQSPITNHLSPIGEDHCHWITNIHPRRNYIIRRSTNLSKQAHIIAANIDQVALIVTINHPATSTTFIDRFLATAEAYRVPAIIIFNKIDLLSDDELAYLNQLRTLYESLGYTTIAISAKHINENKSQITNHKSQIIELFAGQTTLLAGNSGVGKSTLLNALFGKQLTRTADISDAHDTGMHTTTFSEMYFLGEITNNPYLQIVPSGKESPITNLNAGALIDTPGVKGFGSVEMEPHEISHYFREIFRIGQNCRYSDCLHTGEPGCAVLEALTNDQRPTTNYIAPSRYESYLSMLGDDKEQKYR